MHIRLLDRYIFREVFFTFLFGIAAFTTVFVGSGTLFRIAQYMTEYGASLTSCIKIFVLSLPGAIIWTFPMSMLLGTLLAFGRLSGSSEITAMKSCGVSFWRIAAPGLILGLIVSFFAVWFNEYIVPWSNEAYTRVLNYEIRGNTAPKSQDHIILKDIKGGVINRLIYARRYDASKEQMQNITMQLFENGKVSHVENAEYAEWKDGTWTMHQGVIYDIPKEEGAAQHLMHFDTQLLPINDSPRQIVRSQKRPEEMTIRELRETIKLLKGQFVNSRKMEAEFHQRFTVPFASFIFALVGIPLGLQPNRASSSRGFALSIVIIFIYYSFMTMGSAFAQGGTMPAMLAVWIPNIVGLVAGIYLMWKASR